MVSRGHSLQVTSWAGKLAQGFAELNSRTVQAISVIGGLAALGGGVAGLKALMGGFGLSTSAKLLDEAAVHLMAVGGGNLPGGGPGAAARKGRGFRRMGGGLLSAAPVAGTAAELADWAYDTEKAHGAGQQPGADDASAYDSVLGSPRSQPFVRPPMQQYDTFSDALREHQRASQPGWTVNQPQTPFPMTGSGGATAGAGEAPGYINNVTGALDLGGQASAAGASTGSGYTAGLKGELEAAVAAAIDAAERIRAALDFSVSPSIGSTTSPSTPQRSSSLMNYDPRPCERNWRSHHRAMINNTTAARTDVRADFHFKLEQ